MKMLGKEKPAKELRRGSWMEGGNYQVTHEILHPLGPLANMSQVGRGGSATLLSIDTAPDFRRP